MKKASRMVLAGCFVATVAAALATPAVSYAGNPPALEAMLKEGGFDFTRKEKDFKVFVSMEGDSTLVVARETGLGDDPALKMVHLFTPVVQVPKGFKHSPAMLKKIAEINDRLLVGKVSIDTENGDVWFSSSFWQRNADAKVLADELALAHFTRLDMRKELRPFVKE